MFEALILIAVVGAGLFVLFATADTSRTKRMVSALTAWERTLREELGLDDFTYVGGRSVGVSANRRAIAVLERSGRGIWIPFDRIASVELAREYGARESAFAETQTSRGSQIVGAAVGAAVAGPAGLVVGGLSGKTTTHSFASSTQYLRVIHLKMRLYSDENPFLSIPLSDEAEVERIAARIQNAIDCRPTPALTVTATPFEIAEGIQSPSSAAATEKGWWQQTFG